ncbi:ketosteroid isomerase-like protein [Chitinophaga niastensis]|uniref:Ketosteroid isomerase-like protein n=1 Tax=Chitinophaga niastensis TaxID=536980 RepID=A0A2P8HW02_CHINA|nr:DUF4440 domain-containing protein [Chitinophaga niastensis]PSL50348.1 ketosteroid isomerase-like protein [Chitinophaga niastensis]
MRTKKSFIAITLTVISLFHLSHSHAQSKSNLEEAKKDIAASNAVFHQSFFKNDSSIFINCYTDDACLMAPNSPMACGREGIANFFRAGYNAGARSGKLVTTEIYGDGIEFVTEVGWGQVFDKNGTLIDEAKYLVLWKKTAKGWKMYRDSFSSNWRPK